MTRGERVYWIFFVPAAALAAFCLTLTYGWFTEVFGQGPFIKELNPSFLLMYVVLISAPVFISLPALLFQSFAYRLFALFCLVLTASSLTIFLMLWKLGKVQIVGFG
jgi:hypothetical protein